VPSPHEDLQLRLAAPDEYEPVMRLFRRAFGEDYKPDETGAHEGVFEPARTLVFTDGGRIVATAGAETRDVTVPGAIVPGAHVTLVAVHPTYRRRGLLTRLMHRQLRDVREAGDEPVALLWASEGRIYQRFVYGAAAHRLALTVDRREVRLLPRLAASTGTLREADPAEARKELVDLYERVRPDRVGWSSRNDAWWTFILSDPAEHRDGASAMRALLYEGAGGPEGYARWRTKPEWGPVGPAGQATVAELVATTPAAYAELWRFLLSVDLTRTVEFWAGSADEPILSMVEEPRALGGRLSDSLWLRITDVPAALSRRRYLIPLDLVLEVDDPLLPENAGRWRLRADGPSGPATCVPAPAGAEVDLVCDVADLSAAYLGGVSLASLAAAGRVREARAGALATASTAFAWHRSPSATEVF
jgi:predicted acetyltransferase